MNDSAHKKLKLRIEELKKKIAPAPRPSREDKNILLNIACELVAGVIVGLIIGLFLDNLFDSKPLFLIICLIIAFIATFKSMWNKYIR